MDELKVFLQQQKIMQIAPAAGDPWIANVMMSCETPQKLYFVGSTTTLYGQKLLEDPRLAFATAWHAAGNHIDRKGVQGVGNARVASSDEDIKTGVRLHNRDYPEVAPFVTQERVRDDSNNTVLWVITPILIKFWNDALYGEEESREFKF